jgi:hypothetical protein
MDELALVLLDLLFLLRHVDHVADLVFGHEGALG